MWDHLTWTTFVWVPFLPPVRVVSVVLRVVGGSVHYSTQDEVLGPFTPLRDDTTCRLYSAIYSTAQTTVPGVLVFSTAVHRARHIAILAILVATNVGSGVVPVVVGTNKRWDFYLEYAEGAHLAKGVFTTGATFYTDNFTTTRTTKNLVLQVGYQVFFLVVYTQQ